MLLSHRRDGTRLHKNLQLGRNTPLVPNIVCLVIYLYRVQMNRETRMTVSNYTAPSTCFLLYYSPSVHLQACWTSSTVFSPFCRVWNTLKLPVTWDDGQSASFHVLYLPPLQLFVFCHLRFLNVFAAGSFLGMSQPVLYLGPT